MISRNIIIFFLAAILSFVLTPISMRLAYKYRIIDKPDDGRRMHRRSIPCLGGMAIFVSVALTILIFCAKLNHIPVILLGGLIMFALGVLDDKFDIPAVAKFIIQVLVAVFMYIMGIRIQFIHNFFGEGILNFSTAADLIITVLWIVGITNSINLIDGLDGLAAGTVVINTLCMAFIISNDGELIGRVASTMGLIAIAGACFGFLPFNFSPAKTFMGDGGALFLGYMIAVFSTVGKLKSSAVITMLVPIFVLALPLFDTFFAIIRRLFSKTPVMQADKKHLHHVLMESGYGHKRAVIMLYGISGIMGVAAILLSRSQNIEAWILFAVACLYIYVFLTDTTTNKKTASRNKKQNILK